MKSMTRACFLLGVLALAPSLETAEAQSCGSPPSGNLGGGRYQEWCLYTVRGKLVDLGGGRMRCDCSSSGSSSGYSSANNTYTPLVEEFLKFWFGLDANNRAAQERKKTMLRELEAQREQARRNQQAAQAARLDAILQRLLSGDLVLKGGAGGEELRLKLGGEKRPLGMEVYQHPNDGKPRMGISGLSGINLDNETPTTTSARLTLKMGDEATRSLQSAPAGPAPAANMAELSAADKPASATAVDELAKAISQLSPEEQQKLVAALRGDPAPTSSPTPKTAADAELSVKLSGAQVEADAVKAAADSGASPESLKTQAEQQFNHLQQVSAKPDGEAGPAASLDAARTPVPESSSLTPPAGGDGCRMPGTSDASVVDLRCTRATAKVVSGASQPLATEMRFYAPMDTGHPLFLPSLPSEGHALVGGTTWTYGFAWPHTKCGEECRRQVGAKLEQQLNLFCSSQKDRQGCVQAGLPFTPELYDLVVSMGSSHSAIEDLATRVLFDGASYGEFSRRHKEIFAALKGRSLETLDCHSNGAMLCLAALRSGDVQAKTVRLFGPQLNPEAARRWQEFAANTGAKIEIYINNGDPVPSASWKQPTPQTAAGTAATAVWLSNPVTGPAAFADALFAVYVDSKISIMDYTLRDYGFQVTRAHPTDGGCTGSPSIACHSMKLYESLVSGK